MSADNLCWSIDNENFIYTSREDAVEDAAPGAPIYVGETWPVRVSAEDAVDRILEDAYSQACDEAGEWAEGNTPEMRDIPPEAVAEMQVWLDKYVNPHIKCYGVINVREEAP